MPLAAGLLPALCRPLGPLLATLPSLGVGWFAACRCAPHYTPELSPPDGASQRPSDLSAPLEQCVSSPAWREHGWIRILLHGRAEHVWWIAGPALRRCLPRSSDCRSGTMVTRCTRHHDLRADGRSRA